MFYKYNIESQKSELELKSKLEKQTEPKKKFRINYNSPSKRLKYYEGKIEKSTFKINKIIKYQNPFSPRIIGEFKVKYGAGSKVQIILRIKYSFMMFILIYSLAPFFFFYFIRNSLSFEKGVNMELLISVLWFLIIHLLTYFIFNNEKNKSKKSLSELLN